jgi:hypothetical protein
MSAIRNNRNEIADYLIDQLAINVQYTADTCEFRVHSKNPIRQRKLSCRDLAYGHGMMELVDLIDITSDDVTPNIKRYLINRRQTRLANIHQAYLKRLEERNKYLLFQSNNEKEKENEEPPTVNITNENIITSSTLPPITHRTYKSHIEEMIQSIDKSNDKSIDETRKKKFRFSNYTLHFRLLETPDTTKKINEQSQIPSLPTISLYASPSTSTITTNHTHGTISQASPRLPIRDTRTSICRSDRRTLLPQIVPIENKPSMTIPTKQFLPKPVKQNNIQYSYIPQKHALYNQPQHSMPVTLKSTAIGVPSNTRIIRD